MRRDTARYALLKTLAEHPEGLSSKILFTLVNQKKAISHGTQAVFLSHEKKAGILKSVEGVACEHCGATLLRYSLTRLGREEVL